VKAIDDATLDIQQGERLALVGENGAGKSSLMNVLYGLYQPDAGTVRIYGHDVKLKGPKDAIARGIGMVHQHFMLVPSLTVAENVVLGKEPTRRGLFDVKAACAQVDETCRRFGFKLDPRAKVEQLTVGSQQKVEIVKALHRGARTLILDEPTAVLTPQEADELFAVTRELSATGHTVIFISHKLKEVLSVATRIAVMRRGKMVAEVTPAKTSAAELAELMVGPGRDGHFGGLSPNRGGGQAPALRDGESRPGSNNQRAADSSARPDDPRAANSSARPDDPRAADSSARPDDPRGSDSPLRSADDRRAGACPPPGPFAPTLVLEATSLEARGADGRPALRGVSLTVAAGEIVGIAGVDGNGQRELAELLAGLRPLDAGTLTLSGETLRSPTPADLRRLGVAHVPEDRLLRAIVGSMTVEENVSLGRQHLAPFARGARIDFAGRRARTEALLRDYDVRPPDPQARLIELSGGNQQKVVVARELDGAPRLVLAVQPTRGLDISAVAQVHARLRAARDRGCAVLVSSLDLEEVLALADRVYVLFEGRVTGELSRAAFDERAIGRLMLHG
jgi:simple sugar transport system ATP-binding protein